MHITVELVLEKKYIRDLKHKVEKFFHNMNNSGK